MVNLHFVSCICNKTLFVTFMADLELADLDGRKRFCLSKTSTEFASLKRVEHNRTRWKSPVICKGSPRVRKSGI